MRGTEVPVFPSQTWQDLVVTDVLSIGGNGFANNQAVEMIRYYKRLITTGGQAVQYTEQEKWQLFAIKNSLLLPLASVVPVLSVSLAAQFLAFKDELAADRGVSPPPGSATASVLSATEKVDATGHSLGGHLANLFARFFPNNVDEVVTLNAPGLFHQGDLTLTAFGYPPPGSSRITRIEAEGDGVSEIGSLWPGYTVDIAQESRSGPIAAIYQNHSGVNGNDALSIMSTIASLDPTLAHNAAELSNFLRVSSNNAESTYERALDGLRELLLGPDVTPTPVSTEGSDATREDLYLNMYALLKAAVDGGLRPQDGTIRVTQSSPADLAARARSDFAAMSALIALSPLSVNASSPQSIGLLEGFQQSGWGQVFQDWLADKNMSQSDRVAGLAEFSDAWIAARAKMLARLLLMNLKDVEDNLLDPSIGASTTFRDLTKGMAFTIQANGVPPAPQDIRVVAFGSGGSDSLVGGAAADQLFGGNGSDVLNGFAGNDYLEGGDGDDTLRGGSGKDMLLGGAGNDTYVFSGPWGIDSIRDGDRVGSIQVDGYAAGLPNGVRDGANADSWISSDGTVRYTLAGQASGVYDLWITFKGKDDLIVIHDWSSTRSLGITLDQTPRATPTSYAATGDFQKVPGPAPNTYATDGYNFVPGAPLANAADSLWGQPGVNSNLNGLGGNDLAVGSSGNDVIHGGDGNDILLSYQGSDVIHGGAGIDYIWAAGRVSGATAYVTFPGPGPDATPVTYGDWQGYHWGAFDLSGSSGQPFFNSPWLYLYPEAGFYGGDTYDADVLYGGDGNDWLFGAPGEDVLHGDAGNDHLQGGAGRDVIRGGPYNYIESSEHGNDVLDGGRRHTLSGSAQARRGFACAQAL